MSPCFSTGADTDTVDVMSRVVVGSPSSVVCCCTTESSGAEIEACISPCDLGETLAASADSECKEICSMTCADSDSDSF